MLTVEPSFGVLSAGGHTPRSGLLSIAESALSISDSNVGSLGAAGGGTGGTQQSRRRSSIMRRTSRTGSILSSRSEFTAPPRLPVHLDEVASRIEDAAEGTITGWPYNQEPVPRAPNAILNVEEIKQRYGSRMQPFAPVFDVSGSEDSVNRKRARRARKTATMTVTREAQQPNSPTAATTEHVSLYRQVRQPPTRKQLITSNAQLVTSIQIAKKELRIRLREESDHARLMLKVKQWKDRVVDFAPSGLLLRDAKLQYDPLLDPVHLHQECMRDILVEESKVAEELFTMFQQQARDGEEKRRKRQEEDEASSWLPQVNAISVRDKLDGLTNPFRTMEPRAPFHQRLQHGSPHASTGGGDSRRAIGAAVFGETIHDLRPDRDGQGLLPPSNVAPLLLLPYITGSRTTHHHHASRGYGRIVEEIIRDPPQAPASVTISPQPPHATSSSPRRAPWAVPPQPMDHVALQQHNSFVATSGANHSTTINSKVMSPVAQAAVSPRSRMRAELQHVKYVPSSSSHVDAVVRSMVAAHQLHVQEQHRAAPALPAGARQPRRQSKFGEPSDSPRDEPQQNGLHSPDALAPAHKKGRSRSIVSIAAEGLMTKATEPAEESSPLLRPTSPATLPATWPDVHIPSDPNLRAALHERLVSESNMNGTYLLPCPADLFCPMAQEVMSEPILVSNGKCDDADGAAAAPEASLDRSSWEYVLDALQSGALVASKLPPPLDTLFSTATVGRGLAVRMDSVKIVSLVRWRSTSLWSLSNHALNRREAFHIAVGVVNDLIEGAINDDLSQSSSLLRTAKRTGPRGSNTSSPKHAVVEHRRAYPVSMISLRASALDAHQSIAKIAPMLESIRSSGQRVLRSMESLQSTRGCFERDKMRFHVRLVNTHQCVTSPPPTREEIERLDADMHHCDEELNAQSKLLLDLERRYATLRSLWSSLSDRVDAYNEHVAPFNKFTSAQRAYWGPIYKATLSACHTVVAGLINRELAPSSENRTVLQNVAECLEEPTVAEMMAKLPALLVRLETRMRQAKLATSPLLPLTDAAFVIMSPYAQFEDITAAPPYKEIVYPMLVRCPPFLEPDSTTGVASGIAMLRRKSMPLALPASPRGAKTNKAERLASSHGAPQHPHNDEVMSRIVRTAGSDPTTPFWHFVRKSGRSDTSTAAACVSSASEAAQTARELPPASHHVVGLRGTNTPHASSVRMENNKAGLFVVAPGQRFLAHEPKHASARRP